MNSKDHLATEGNRKYLYLLFGPVAYCTATRQGLKYL